jgi:hypothetical protein
MEGIGVIYLAIDAVAWLSQGLQGTSAPVAVIFLKHSLFTVVGGGGGRTEQRAFETAI